MLSAHFIVWVADLLLLMCDFCSCHVVSLLAVVTGFMFANPIVGRICIVCEYCRSGETNTNK